MRGCRQDGIPTQLGSPPCRWSLFLFRQGFRNSNIISKACHALRAEDTYIAHFRKMKIFNFSKQQYRYPYFSAPFFGDRGQERTVGNGILCSSAAGGKENSMYFDANDFATRLQTLRKALGMTQEELAEALNVSLEHLSKMERGKRKPSIDLIVAMACYFHVSTDYLLMRKDHDKVDSRTKLLDVVAQLAEIAKSL